MEVTKAHHRKALEPLKAVAGGQRTLCFGGSSCRPVPLPTLPWGCTGWDGSQGGWGAKPAGTQWCLVLLVGPTTQCSPGERSAAGCHRSPYLHGLKNSYWEGVGKEIYGDSDAFASPQGYMKPLKQPENSLLCDPSLVDEIFDQIPELLEHHEQFLEQIHDCVQNWHEKQKVGDLLVQSVGPRYRGGFFPWGNPGMPALRHGPSGRNFGAGGKGVIKGQAKRACDGEQETISRPAVCLA